MPGHHKKDDIDTAHHLLNAPYPFEHQHYKKIYEKTEKSSGISALVLYHCNICQLKLLNIKELFQHNKCFGHLHEMEKRISEMIDKRTKDGKVQSIAISEPSKMAKMKLREAALNVANMRLSEECTRLRCDYKQYEINPFSHPMYAKEWRIFYCQTLSQLAAANKDPGQYDFKDNWNKYWKERAKVYLEDGLSEITANIAKNFKFTVTSSDSSDKSSDDEMYRSSKSTSSTSVCDIDSMNFSDDTKCNNGISEGKHVTSSDMHTSNGTDDNPQVSNGDVPKPIKLTNTNDHLKPAENSKNNVFKFDQNAVDVAVVVTVEQHLDRCGINPKQLTDEQLTAYIQYAITSLPYQLNLRSASIENQS